MQVGSAWARTSAEFDELERVATHQGDADLSDLCSLIGPDNEMDRHDWLSFWDENGGQPGDDEIGDAFASGFVGGASKVYEEVKDEL